MPRNVAAKPHPIPRTLADYYKRYYLIYYNRYYKDLCKISSTWR